MVQDRPTSTELTLMDEKAMAIRIANSAKFVQDLSQQEKQVLNIAARTYGFDPVMGEMTIYQGRPYVSIDGRLRKAQETGKFDGIETRPANKQERSDWDIPDGDYFFRSEVYVKGSSRPFVGWGRVFVRETKPGSSKQGDTTSTFKPIQSNPQRMAEKRAEAMALRKAFHIPLPSIEDIGGPEDEPLPEYARTTVIVEQPEQVTSEPIESTAEVMTDKPKRDLTTIKTNTDMVKACFTDFGMQPPEVLKELNVSRLTDLTEKPAESYQRIAAVRK